MGRIYKSGFGNNSNVRNNNDKQKTNWYSIPEVRLIDEKGEMVGVVPTKRALQMAKELNLDLINVSPNSNPPVCKICDYGKYKYDQQKKQKGNKKITKLKEIQLTINIGENELEMKLKKAIEFLKNKQIVQIIMQLKGRDIQRIDSAMQTMNKIYERMKTISKQIDNPKVNGRKIILMCR